MTPKKPKFCDLSVPRSPATPRHRVSVGAKPLTPRTPRTLNSPALQKTVYAPAKQLFARSAAPCLLVGRDDEKAELNSLIQKSLDEKKGRCLYVSGPPGTGKSAAVADVFGKFEPKLNDSKNVRVVNVNCASITNAKDIYGKIVEVLCPNAKAKSPSKSEADILQSLFSSKTKTSVPFYIVALDEIDHLLSSSEGASPDSPSILSSLFEWSLRPNTRLLLLGIANALDLTDRFLPRLKTKNMKPDLIPFMPYTPPQIASIITYKLRTLLPDETSAAPDFIPFMQPAAIQLCARKVASTTGDLRKAFDIVRKTVDLVERETFLKVRKPLEPLSPTKPSPLAENTNLASRPSARMASPPNTPGQESKGSRANNVPSKPAYTVITAPRATVAHIAKVTASVFSHGTTERLADLNLQQKAVLCALIATKRREPVEQENINSTSAGVPRTPKKRAAQPTVKRLLAMYTSLCRRENVLSPLSPSDFRDVISSLETLGLIGLENAPGTFTPSRSAGRGKHGVKGDEAVVMCLVREKEVLDALEGVGSGALKKLVNGFDH